MKNNFLLSLLGLLLSACALAPPPAPPAPEPAPLALALPVPAPADEVNPMLAYQQSLRRMSPAELVRELHSQNNQPKGVRQAMRVALVLMHTRAPADLVRAQGLLDNVAAAAAPEAHALAPLARLLAAHCGDLRRLAEHNDKLAAQLKENQRRTEQLNEMLEGLKAIERTLPARPNAGVGTLPGAAK